MACRERCSDNCDCKSYAQCQQNAEAFIAASTYTDLHEKAHKENKGLLNKIEFQQPKKFSGVPTSQCHTKKQLKCAAKDARHRVDYYDSGQFGDAVCDYCGNMMLKGEHDKCFGRACRVTPCCSNGACHTEEMKREYDELQSPPKQLVDLADAKDKQLRDQFLGSTMHLNNQFAFASTHSEKETRPDQMAGRMDTCKYNGPIRQFGPLYLIVFIVIGQFSFQFSDLIAPKACRPTFAQVYTLTPEDALKLRDENLSSELKRACRREILAKLDDLMRENPYGQTFQTAGEKIADAKARNGEIPKFQVSFFVSSSFLYFILRSFYLRIVT